MSVYVNTGRTTKRAIRSPRLAERLVSSARMGRTACPGSHAPKRANRALFGIRAKGVKPGVAPHNNGKTSRSWGPSFRSRQQKLSGMESQVIAWQTKRLTFESDLDCHFATAHASAHHVISRAPTVLSRSGLETNP